MTIIANDKNFDVTPGTALPSFLDTIGHKLGMVVVERNGQALSPSEAAQVTLEDGDRLEIVRIVAGG